MKMWIRAFMGLVVTLALAAACIQDDAGSASDATIADVTPTGVADPIAPPLVLRFVLLSDHSDAHAIHTNMWVCGVTLRVSRTNRGTRIHQKYDM